MGKLYSQTALFLNFVWYFDTGGICSIINNQPYYIINDYLVLIILCVYSNLILVQ